MVVAFYELSISHLAQGRGGNWDSERYSQEGSGEMGTPGWIHLTSQRRLPWPGAHSQHSLSPHTFPMSLHSPSHFSRFWGHWDQYSKAAALTKLSQMEGDQNKTYEQWMPRGRTAYSSKLEKKVFWDLKNTTTESWKTDQDSQSTSINKSISGEN